MKGKIKKRKSGKLKITLEYVKGEFESFGELFSVLETGMELLFQW